MSVSHFTENLRRFVKAITIDETAALRSVQGSPWERSAQVAMIQRIVNGDFFTVVDRFGRFHTNLTNLKATLRPSCAIGTPILSISILRTRNQ